MSDLLNQASLVMVPSGYKEDTVYSVVPTNGNGDLSFTRASNGTRINSAGLVEDCPWNLVTYSEEFNNTSGWTQDPTNGSITITANYGVAPNGTTTADRIQITKGTNYSQVYQTSSVISGAVYTISVYLKSLSGTPTITTLYDSSAKGTQTLTTEWVRYEFSFTASSGTIYPMVALYGSNSASMDVLAWGFQLNIGSTAKPYFPTTDRLNVPRLTYQNGGGGCPSLLLEKQSTNYFTYSEELQTGTGGTLTVTPNTTISPDGTQNADSLGTGYLTKSLSALAGTWTFSTFAKYLSANTVQIYIYDGVYYDATFNVSTGVVTSSSAGVTASIQNMGNGWYRCIITATTANNVSEVGFNTGNVYAWGCQLE